MQRGLLYTDGYIATTLGAQEAPLYFTHLLQFGERLLQLYITPETMSFFIMGPAVQHAPYSTYIFNRAAWLLDYRVRDYGTVVPQKIWSPTLPGDAQRHYSFTKMPIFFVFGDRTTLGIQLTQAAAGHCGGLLNGHAPAPFVSCSTTYIRIGVSVSQVARCVAISPIVCPFSGQATSNSLPRS